jgi:hypothetical protein
MGVYSAIWLFWHRKITGSFQTPARFIASCTAPMLVAPSPKLTNVTRSSARIWAASASPLAIGAPPPTMAVVSIEPEDGSEMCGEQAVERDALGHLVVNAAIGRHHVVARAGQLGECGGNGFLPRRRPVREHKPAAREPRLNSLVDGTDPRHLPIDFGQYAWLDAKLRSNGLLHDDAPL